MAKLFAVTPKKRGRPATGRHSAITVRLPPELVVYIQKWAAIAEITRSEAIRRLLEKALDAESTKER